jgi:hypothetical protein
MEYLEENLEEWMSAELEGYGDDDYLVFDCPGQVGACFWGGGEASPTACMQLLIYGLAGWKLEGVPSYGDHLVFKCLGQVGGPEG